MIDHLKPIVVGLVWSENEDLKYQTIQSFVPPGQITNYWYTPNATLTDASEWVDKNQPDKLAAMNKRKPEDVPAYLESVRKGLEYPFFWDSLRIRLPIQEIFNAKVGSAGENVNNRVTFQILDALLNLYGKLPGFSFQELVDTVKAAGNVRASFDDYMTDKWSEDMEKIVTHLDENCLLRNAKTRLRQLQSEYDRELMNQWNNEEDNPDGNGLLDKLNKQLCVFVPDVKTKDEAKWVLSQDNGIMIDVNQVEAKRLGIKKKHFTTSVTSDDIYEIREAIYLAIKQLGA